MGRKSSSLLKYQVLKAVGIRRVRPGSNLNAKRGVNAPGQGRKILANPLFTRVDHKKNKSERACRRISNPRWAGGAQVRKAYGPLELS